MAPSFLSFVPACQCIVKTSTMDFVNLDRLEKHQLELAVDNYNNVAKDIDNTVGMG